MEPVDVSQQGGVDAPTGLFAAIGDDVVMMHGHSWRVCAREVVRIEEVTDPQGAPLGAANWRAGYRGVSGRAVFAHDANGKLAVVQVRSLVYAQGEGCLRATHDILRTSSGVLLVDNDAYILVTKRTRYVFRCLDGQEKLQVEAVIQSIDDNRQDDTL